MLCRVSVARLFQQEKEDLSQACDGVRRVVVAVVVDVDSLLVHDAVGLVPVVYATL